MQNNYFWRGRRVFLTGHTGFKGSWLSLVLDYLGAEIFGVSVDCKTQKGPYFSCGMDKKLQSDIRLDIRDANALKEYIYFIEDKINCPIKIISIGPQRHQTILR